MNEVEIDIRVTDSTGPGLASALSKIAAARKVIDGMSGDVNLKFNVAGAGIAGAAASADKAAFSFTRWGGAIRALNNVSTPLFGKMPKWVPGILATATGFHMVAEAALETAAVVGPAAIAFGAFGAAAVPTVRDIYSHMQQVVTVSEALGRNIYPLSGSFAKVADAVKPEVYVLLGEALNTINSKTGAFQTLATGAGRVIDQLGLRAEMALGGKGLTGILGHGVNDLQILGSIGGDVLGSLGNLLRPMPGYAESLFNALEHVTHGIEDITASGAFQTIEHSFLVGHGALLYGGLAGALSGKAITGGLTGIAGLAGKAAVKLEGMGTYGAKAATAMDALAGGAGVAAGLPWGWIAAAAVAVGVLAYKLATAKDAAQQWGASLKVVLDKQPAIRGYTLALSDTSIAAGKLAAAQKIVAENSKSVVTYTTRTGQTLKIGNAAYNQAAQNASDYSGILTDLQDNTRLYNYRMGVLSHTFGSTAHAQSLMTAAGITFGDMTKYGRANLDKLIIEMQAAQSAFRSLSLGTGRQAAAFNALNFASSDAFTQMQKIVQAEDTLLNVVTGGESAFYGFITSLKQTGLHAYSASSGFKALSQQAQRMGDFYNSLVPSGQKLLDNLQLQGISTGKLATVTATAAKEMLVYAGHNEAARATVEAFINNALGPGTVNLKNLNHWVGQNSTSLSGMNRIVAESTIKAGSLAHVLESQLNTQFHEALLQASGADGAIKAYANDLVHNQQDTSRGHSDRAQLIRDLEAAGLSAKQAAQYVDGLNSALRRTPHRDKVYINVQGAGKTTFRVGTTGLTGMAAGGKLPGFGGGDKHLRLLESGEAVVNKHATAKFAPVLRAMGVPGMETGGVVGSFTGSPPALGKWMVGQEGKAEDMLAGFIGADIARMVNSAMAKAASSGAVGGNAGANQAIGMRMAARYGWTGIQWADLVRLWNMESGWNRFARNPTSGAYGIAQALPPTKYPFAGQAAGGSHAGAQIGWGLGYIRGRYGSPMGALGHELQYGWYDHGGDLRPGLTLAYNGTGRTEHVSPAGATTTLEIVPGGNGDFERFMARFIKNFVRVKGGGDVQAAFGRK